MLCHGDNEIDAWQVPISGEPKGLWSEEIVYSSKGEPIAKLQIRMYPRINHGGASSSNSSLFFSR